MLTDGILNLHKGLQVITEEPQEGRVLSQTPPVRLRSRGEMVLCPPKFVSVPLVHFTGNRFVLLSATSAPFSVTGTWNLTSWEPSLTFMDSGFLPWSWVFFCCFWGRARLASVLAGGFVSLEGQGWGVRGVGWRWEGVRVRGWMLLLRNRFHQEKTLSLFSSKDSSDFTSHWAEAVTVAQGRDLSGLSTVGEADAKLHYPSFQDGSFLECLVWGSLGFASAYDLASLPKTYRFLLPLWWTSWGSHGQGASPPMATRGSPTRFFLPPSASREPLLGPPGGAREALEEETRGSCIRAFSCSAGGNPTVLFYCLS